MWNKGLWALFQPQSIVPANSAIRGMVRTTLLISWNKKELFADWLEQCSVAWSAQICWFSHRIDSGWITRRYFLNLTKSRYQNSFNNSPKSLNYPLNPGKILIWHWFLPNIHQFTWGITIMDQVQNNNDVICTLNVSHMMYDMWQTREQVK